MLQMSRFGYGGTSTLSRMLVDGQPNCFTLEDERRLVKVYGETCIPKGRYQLGLRAEGPTHEKYLARFPAFHVGMIWILDVHDFLFIYLHLGNFEYQTKGCPLVGSVPVCTPTGEFQVMSSEAAYVPLYQRVIERMDTGPAPFLDVIEL